MPNPLDQLCINTVRFLSVDAVQKANSGHPGLPLGAAPMAYVLWTRLLKHNPRDPDWFDRDRFVLSAGHGSMLLYSLLHLTGYDLSLDEIKRFRQWGSKAPGHPERGHTPGVEITTGPLGQGIANAVGMAIAEAQLAARYNRPGFEVIDHATYALVSDGDLMEGVGAEAASLAGHLRLGKLICLYDDNRVTLAAGTDITFSEDRARRFEAYGWHTVAVADGNDLEAIDAALQAARAETTRPSLILVRTHIGYGSPHKQDTFEAHGSPLGADEVRLTKQKLGWPTEPPFLIPEPALAHFREALARGARDQAAWNDRMTAYARAFPEAGAGAAAKPARRAAARLGRGHPGLSRRRQGHRHARRLRQGDECDRAAASGPDRRLGGPRSVHPHRARKDSATSIRRPARTTISRAPAAAAGVAPDATCTSACASTRWARSSTAWRRTAGSCRTARPS